MHSKWNDVGILLASFHYQSAIYDKLRPPSFGQHEELHNLVRERFRRHECSPDELKRQLSNVTNRNSPRGDSSFLRWGNTGDNDLPAVGNTSSMRPRRSSAMKDSSPTPTSKLSYLDGGLHNKEASLFLQELSHLLSLLSAVALSTLRLDVEGTEIPLVEYAPSSGWPPVDPDRLSRERRAAYDDKNWCLVLFRFMFGMSRNAVRRTQYNAARPFRVLGGVSDAEAMLLRSARGPTAQVSLCAMWLQEFITREHIAGSTGTVAPPNISRLYQFISDGMVGYNEARKVACVPFPFPHAQLSVLFTFVLVFMMPILMYSFVHGKFLACIINFSTVLCFTGLHEVARELENPFQNVPNDIPLTYYQAQFNESLLAMFAGFHPDAFWKSQVSTTSCDVHREHRHVTSLETQPAESSDSSGEKLLKMTSSDYSAISSTGYDS